MAHRSRLSDVTRTLLRGVPDNFKELITQTAEGRNPYITFSFTEVKVIRGTQPHPPNTDDQEVRNSLTVQFNGTSSGTMVAHLFNDGSVKTREQMHAEVNRRRELEQRLLAEERQLPALGHTAIRRAAEDRKAARIRAARNNSSMSIIAKQLEKQNAEAEYNDVLQRLAQARAVAMRQRR